MKPDVRFRARERAWYLIPARALVFAPFRRRGIEDFDEIGRSALQRLRQPQNHRQARHLYAPLQVADEWFARCDELRKRVLRQIPLEPELAEAAAEDLSFRLRLRRHAADFQLIEDALGDTLSGITGR